MIALSLFLLIPALSAVSPNDDCQPATDAQTLAFKQKAERLFLAYTEGAVRSYEVLDPLDCPNRVFVAINATGKDARLGGTWMFTFDKNDRTITIRLGE